MKKELIKKMVEGKLDLLQNWTINHSKNLQSHLISKNEEEMEMNLQRIKQQVEYLNKIREEALEDIMGIIEMAKEEEK